jgi:hypothetical protein
MIGISIAPKRMEAMTQIATVITHTSGQVVPILRVNPHPFVGACAVIYRVCRSLDMQNGGAQQASVHSDEFWQDNFSKAKMAVQAAQESNDAPGLQRAEGHLQNILAQYEAEKIYWEQQQLVSKIVQQMSHEVAEVYKEIGRQTTWLDDMRSAQDYMMISGESLPEAETAIREWLTRLNDICRIASFFHAEERLHSKCGTDENPKQLLECIEAMFADENLPEIEVEMELCRRFPGGALGKFSLIDTPGPDEAMQGAILYEKVQQVLQDSDAVICVINGKQLKNNAQQSVLDLIKKMKKFDMQDNIMVLINHIDQSPKSAAGQAQEMAMRASTAASFLDDATQTNLVHPTSAFQGLCNLQMSRLVDYLEGAYPDPKQHACKDGHAAAGYQLLLQHLQGIHPYTAPFTSDWVATSYGVDGLPADWWTDDEKTELDEDDAPKNLLKVIKKKNDARWAQSRLQAPMEIVFSSWAGNVACKKLRSALTAMSSIGALQKQWQDVYEAATANTDDPILDKIQELESKLRSAKHYQDLHARDQTEANVELGEAASKIMVNVLIGLQGAITESDDGVQSGRKFPEFRQHATPLSFLEELGSQQVGADRFHEGKYFDKDGWANDAQSERYSVLDTRVYLSNAAELTKTQRDFKAKLTTEMDRFLENRTNELRKLLIQHDKKSAESFSDYVDKSARGTESPSGDSDLQLRELMTARTAFDMVMETQVGFVNDLGKILDVFSFSERKGFESEAYQKLARAGTIAAGTGMVMGAFVGAAGASVLRMFGARVGHDTKYEFTLGHVELLLATKSAAEQASGRWAEKATRIVEARMGEASQRFERAYEGHLARIQRDIDELKDALGASASSKEERARRSAGLICLLEHCSREIAEVEQHCAFRGSA